MNKMEQILSTSGNDLLKRRSNQVASLIEMEQESVRNNLKRDVLVLEGELETVMDVSVRSRDSLSPTSEDFSAKSFVDRIQKIKVDLRNKRIEYTIAQDTYEDLFSQAKVEDK